jgi:hypothetical protein
MIITSRQFTSVDQARAFYLDSLNEAIDAVRDRYYPNGFFIALEYGLMFDQAGRFKGQDYKGDVPAMINSYAQASRVSPQHAAIKILAAKILLDHMLQTTCHARLMGREAISVAEGVSQMRAAHDAALESLKNLPDPEPF